MATNIQIKRSAVPSLRVEPTALSLGTPFVNVSDEDPGLYFRSANAEMLKIGPTHVGLTAPNSVPAGSTLRGKGEQWLDITTANTKLKTWDGADWVEHRNSSPFFYQEATPTLPNINNGDLWFKPGARELYVYWSGDWYDIQRAPDSSGIDHEVQFYLNGEFAGSSQFLYYPDTDKLVVGNIHFTGSGGEQTIKDLGPNYALQLNNNNDLTGTAKLIYDTSLDKLVCEGDVVLGEFNGTNSLIVNATSELRGDTDITGDLTISGSTDISGGLTVSGDAVIGLSQAQTLTINANTFVNNNMMIGDGLGDLLHVQSLSTFYNDVNIGTDDSKDLVIKSDTFLHNEVKLENSATLVQWYIERLSNTEISNPQQGHVLVHGPGNKWYNEAPGAGPYGNVVEEAPEDGVKYARQDKTWVPSDQIIPPGFWEVDGGLRTIASGQNVIPHGSASLGTSTDRWDHIYTNDLHLSNEGSGNSVDGTWGDWTLQEGEDEIYMINNRSNQKFKIALIPV